MKSKLTWLVFALGCGFLTPLIQAQNTNVLVAENSGVPSGTNSTDMTSGEVVPLITIDDAPLPDAIKTLARQANINFQFDPRLFPSVAGEDGKTVGPPTVSFRWENVTALQALNALLDNHDLHIVHNSQTRISKITKKDPPGSEPMSTRVLTLKHAPPTNLTNLVDILRATLSPKSRVIADTRSGKIVVMATENELTAITEFLTKLDVPANQILIETRFFETTTNPKSVKGVDWSGTLQGQRVTFGNGLLSGRTTSTTPGTTTGTGTTPGGRPTGGNSKLSESTTMTTDFGSQNFPLGGLSLDTARGFYPSTAFLSADGASAVLSFLNTDFDTESIASPRAIAMEGQPTELAVIRNIPIFEQQQGIASGAGTAPTTVKPNYDLKVNGTVLNEVGIKLLVTPRVVGSSNIHLDLRPEISAQELVPASVRLDNKVSESPIFSRRKLNTQAIVPSGNTLVLGGLFSNESNKKYTKVPILGDIPVLGLAFRKDEKERNKRNLLIFVTPTIVSESDFQARELSPGFLKTAVDGKIPEETSAWDGGKPHDWTKPTLP